MNKLTCFTLSTALLASFVQLCTAQPSIPLQPRTRPLIDNSAGNLTREERKALKAADIKKLIESKRFVFTAQYANPLGAGLSLLSGQLSNLTPAGSSPGHIYLSNSYEVKVKPDSVISDLPFYGSATADAGYDLRNDKGLKFTSTKYGYETITNNKGKTLIIITPKDSQNNLRMIFSIHENGNANLQVTLTNRSAISYDGFIAEKSI